MDILGQSSLLVAVISFALGFSILARNVRNKLFLSYAVVCSITSLWAMSFFLERIWPGWGFYRLHLFFNVWLAPAVLAFIRLLVRIQDDKLSRRLLDLSVLVAVPLSSALAFHLETYPGVSLLINFVPTLVTIQIIELMLIDFRFRRGAKRQPKLTTVGLSRRTLIYLGGLCILSLTVMDHVPWLGTTLPALGNLALAGYLFFISQAISQQRLLNFGVLISKSLVLIAVAFTLTAVYALLVAWIENSPGLFFLNSFIASFLILMLLDPLRALVGYFMKRLMTQKHRRLEQVLSEARMKLNAILDPGSLFQAVLLTVEHTLQPQRAALFVLRSDGTKFRRVRAVGQEPPIEPGKMPPLREILADHPLLKLCDRLYRKGDLPVLLDTILENEMDRTSSRQQREALASHVQGLRALGCSLLIPLIDSGQILAFVTLYAPDPPEPWGGNWGLLHIVYPYFEQAAQTLRNMEIYVRQREKERLATIGQMAAGLAHEIRNPLGAIKGAAQFLDPSTDRPESRFLRVIVEETDRLNRVVTQFLDYSRPQIDEFKPIDLNLVANKTVELMRQSVRQEILLEFTPASGPALVMAAPDKLQQVLLNFIGNSEKALGDKLKGYIKVAVEVESAAGKNPDIYLWVEDNGSGIKKENLEKLFIPFFTTSPSGTGLGLSISQKIVESHRGRIEVASEEGRFTRFTVVLPSAPAGGANS